MLVVAGERERSGNAWWKRTAEAREGEFAGDDRHGGPALAVIGAPAWRGAWRTRYSPNSARAAAVPLG